MKAQVDIHLRFLYGVRRIDLETSDIRHLRFLVSSFHRKSDLQYDLLCERGGTGSSNICLNENGTWRRAEKLAAFIMGYRQGNGDSLWGSSRELRTYIPETHRYIEI